MSAIYLQSRNAGKALLQLNLRHNQCSRGLEEPLQIVHAACALRLRSTLPVYQDFFGIQPCNSCSSCNFG